MMTDKDEGERETREYSLFFLPLSSSLSFLPFSLSGEFSHTRKSYVPFGSLLYTFCYFSSSYLLFRSLSLSLSLTSFSLSLLSPSLFLRTFASEIFQKVREKEKGKKEREKKKKEERKREKEKGRKREKKKESERVFSIIILGWMTIEG